MYTFHEAHTPEAYAACADIWYKTSIAGHWFIPASFWEEQRQAMEAAYLPASHVVMAENNGIPLGFIVTRDDMLHALFVSPSNWGFGLGSALLKRELAERRRLVLSVYTQNHRAIRFYTSHGFTPLNASVCPHTGAPEWSMQWTRL